MSANTWGAQMPNTQYIGGGVTSYVWKPDLIKLTAAGAKSFVAGTDLFINPSDIVFVRRLDVDPEGVLDAECTYVYLYNTGIYVQEQPDEINRLRCKALSGDEDQPDLKVVG